jgi:N-acetyl-gamma-glutamyl-phosphate reductase
MEKIKVGIIGGAGYTGGETIRLLLNHPFVELTFVHSRSNAGKLINSIHPDLAGETSLKFVDTIQQDIDVLFLCLGHGESKKHLEVSQPENIKVIDLSQDFRLGESYNGYEFVYGLPELNREAIRFSSYVANPGCFATAIELGLLPLAADKKLSEVFSTGITGSTGAGQRLQDTAHFTWRANNISAYKTLTHQHLKEINRSLLQLDGEFKGPVNFVPWRGDFTRGIFVSSTITTDMSLKDLNELYQSFYETHPFTHVLNESVSLKQVVNTNKCLINIEKEGNKAVIHSAIDNLLKGASGQAVQNLNLMFDIEESAGLKLKGAAF